jgi:hypothetical protein
MPRGEIGQRSLNDPGFLSQLEAGRNIRLRTFETFMTWLGVHWPADSSFFCRDRGVDRRHYRAAVVVGAGAAADPEAAGTGAAHARTAIRHPARSL